MDWTIAQWLVAAWFAWRTALVPLVVAGASAAVAPEKWTPTAKRRTREYWASRAAEAALLAVLIIGGFF